MEQQARAQRGSRLDLAWRQVAALTALQTVISMTNHSYAALGIAIQADLGLSNTQLGSLPTAIFAGASISTVAWGWLVDRTSPRSVILLGSGLMAVAALAAGWADAYAPLLSLLLVLGLGSGSAPPVIITAISRWFPPGQRGVALGIKEMGSPLGGAIGAAWLPLAAAAWGWSHTFQVVGVVLLVAVSLTYRSYRDPEAGRPRVRASQVSMMAVTFVNPVLPLLFVAGFAYTAFQQSLLTFLLPYLTRELHVSTAEATAYLALTYAAGVVARPLQGYLSDVCHTRRGFLIGSGFASGVAGVGLAYLPHQETWTIGPLLIVLGTTALGWSALHAAFITELVPPSFIASATACGTAFNLLGVALGPIVFGGVADASGEYRLPLILSAALVLLGAIVLASFRSAPLGGQPTVAQLP